MLLIPIDSTKDSGRVVWSSGTMAWDTVVPCLLQETGGRRGIVGLLTSYMKMMGVRIRCGVCMSVKRFQQAILCLV